MQLPFPHTQEHYFYILGLITLFLLLDSYQTWSNLADDLISPSTTK